MPSRHPPSEFRKNCNCHTCITLKLHKRKQGSIIKIFDERDSKDCKYKDEY